jgi:hypothetical protein
VRCQAIWFSASIRREAAFPAFRKLSSAPVDRVLKVFDFCYKGSVVAFSRFISVKVRDIERDRQTVGPPEQDPPGPGARGAPGSAANFIEKMVIACP